MRRSVSSSARSGLSENGALFLAAAQGYFKAEGIDLAMTAYDSDKAVAEMLASGRPTSASRDLLRLHSMPRARA